MISFKEWLNEQDLNEGIRVDPILARELVRDQVKALNKILTRIAKIKKYTAIKAVKLDSNIKSVKKIADLGYDYAVLVNDNDRASVLLKADVNEIFDYVDHDKGTEVSDDFTKQFYPTQIFGLRGE